MSDTQTRGGFIGFMTTIPGILTAIGAVITAAVPIYLSTADKSSSRPSPTPTATTTEAAMTINFSVGGATPPSDATTVDQQSLRLANAPVDASGLESADPVQQLITQCGEGDDSACLQILDALTQDCSDGSGLACDALYEVSPIGSDYEAYGATCGGRLPDAYADTCSEQ